MMIGFMKLGLLFDYLILESTLNKVCAVQGYQFIIYRFEWDVNIAMMMMKNI